MSRGGKKRIPNRLLAANQGVSYTYYAEWIAQKHPTNIEILEG